MPAGQRAQGKNVWKQGAWEGENRGIGGALPIWLVSGENMIAEGAGSEGRSFYNGNREHGSLFAEPQ